MTTQNCPNFLSIREKLPDSDQDLDPIRSMILRKVSEYIGIPLTDANPTTEFTIHDKITDRELVRLYPDNKINQVTPEIMRWGINKDPNIINGFYDARHGKIILNSTKWCLHTLIHESLHSVSNFSRIYESLPSQEFPCEGINELITGYVLCFLSNDINQKNFNDDCCLGWNNPNYCFISRLRTDVMIFYFISAKITMEEMLSIYLDPIIENPFSEITQKIRNTGIDFLNVFETGWTAPVVGRRYLQDELAKCYEDEFTTFMSQGLPSFHFPPKI